VAGENAILARLFFCSYPTTEMRPKSAWLPTLFFGIIAANIVSLSLMEFFEAATWLLSIVYPAVFAIAVWQFRSAGVPFPMLSRRTHGYVAAVVAVLALPRIAYFLEPVLGYSTDAACWDDWWLVQEFSSIIYSPHFPPESTLAHGFYFSFYFAPWILGAALFQLLHLGTVKQAIFLTGLIYNFAFVYAAVYAAKLAFPQEPRRSKLLLGVVLLYGGFDIFFGLFKLLHGAALGDLHAEWWAYFLGFKVQYASTMTLMLWVPHHLAGALATLLGYHCLKESPSWRGTVVAGICFGFAGFSSVFATLGAIPVIGYLFLRNRVPLKWGVLAGVLAILLGLPIFWMYLGRKSEGFILFGALTGGWESHKVLAFGGFLLVVIAEFFPLLLASVLALRERTFDRGLFLVVLGFLLSNYFVAFAGFNNFAMRGAIVPAFALYYLAIPGLERILDWKQRKASWLRYCLLAFFLGGLWEYVDFTAFAMQSTGKVSKLREEILVSNLTHGQPPSAELLAKANRTQYGWYALENRKSVDKPGLNPGDIELLNRDNQYRLTFKRLFGTAK